MKYIGVDRDGGIWCFTEKPQWYNKQDWRISDWLGDKMKKIPPEILPSLEPCCLYQITKDAYVLIEDRREK